MSGLSPGPWPLLSMVVLLCWTRSLVVAQEEISAFYVDGQSNTSVTLKWEPPNSNYTVTWAEDGQVIGTSDTSDTQYTVKDLQPGTTYEFTVRVQGSSSGRNLTASTLPNEVRDLRMDARSNGSVTLKWLAPDGPQPADYTYWISWGREDDLLGEDHTTEMEHMVDNLAPATVYNFTVRAEKNGVNSSGQSVQEATVPNEVRDLRMDARSNGSVTLKWLAPDGPQPADYTYWISWGREDDLLGEDHTTEMEHMVDNLAPATVYNFTVRAEKNGVNSSGQSVQEATVPNEVRDLRMDARSNGSVTLKWLAPDGPQPADYTYWVSWNWEGVPRGADKATAEQYTAEHLEPGSPYVFTICSMSNEVNSSAQMLRVFTEPNEVRNLEVANQTNNSIAFSWMVPEGPTEPTYKVSWFESETHQRQIFTSGTVFTNGTNFTAYGLTPGTWYQLSVRSVTEDGAQSPERTVNASTAPDPVTITSCTSAAAGYGVVLTLACPAGNQESLEYQLGDHQGTRPGPCNSSMSIGGLQPGQSYTAIVWTLWAGMCAASAPVTCYTESRASNPGVIAGVIIGVLLFILLAGLLIFFHQRHRRKPIQEKPQAPGVAFSFLGDIPAENLAAYVLENQKDSNYGFAEEYQQLTLEGTGQLQAAALAPENKSKNRFSNVLPCENRDTLPPPRPQGEPETPFRSPGSLGVMEIPPPAPDPYPYPLPRDSQRSHAPPGSPGQIEPSYPCPWPLTLCGRQSCPIPTSPWEKQIQYSPLPLPSHPERPKDAASSFLEAQTLPLPPISRVSPLLASILSPFSVFHYRFLPVFTFPGPTSSSPLQMTGPRVPLQPTPGDPSSDYINASFVPGLVGPREYIATQGPLPQTMSDFWHLVWEQQSHTIVMLTNCVESGLVKCEHYWPLDAKPCSHGHLRVTLKGENVAEHWTIRDLHLFHMELKEGLSVRQFHYTVWPDHGVPRSPDPLLAFQALLRNWLDQSLGGGPPIVHCSAGVGRTGTLIALDVLLRQLQKYQRVGVHSFVRKMRRSRPLMVQTEGQYIFLYQALLRFLQLSQDSGEDCIGQEGVLYENVEAIQAYEQEIGMR
ncbi:receptor-type tyrosine-protein phosphatase H [Phascolarctos cinereus]